MKFFTGLICFIWLFVCIGFSQNVTDPDHKVILLGNTAGIKPDALILQSIKEQVASSQAPVTILVLGDILDKNGLGSDINEVDAARLKELVRLADGGKDTKIYFLPGDRDWDNSKRKGLKKVENLEDYLQKDLGAKKSVIPSDGCPGPKVIELNDNLILVAINTQWWMHPFDKPTPADAECDIATTDDFYEELEGIIDEAEQKNILIAGHHPLYSNGNYGGHGLLKENIFPLTDKNPNLYIPLPVVGSMYVGFRQNVGTVRDMASKHYQEYFHKMSLILADRNPLIYASGHEYDLEALKVDGNYHINSGSVVERRPVGKSPETIFKKSAKGFIVLDYMASGEVNMQVMDHTGSPLATEGLFASACQTSGELPANTRFIPCKDEVVFSPTMDAGFVGKKALTEGGAEYAAGGLKKLFLGKHWRDSWTQQVEMPYLNLDTEKGGLVPFAEGGGRQTTSLKFKAGDGREYVFRSVNKDPYKALTRDLRGTVVSDIVKDQTTTQHPYGALVVDKLANHAGILHAHPVLYLLPDDPKLGPFQKKFANLFGMLEDRPKGPKEGIDGFEGSDDVDRSVKLFKKLYDDHDVRVDHMAFGKARVFDIFIGDWGRHRDNWKWAGYEQGNGDMIYKPIPRDRDHAFSRWDGVLPWLADREWAKTNAEDFDYHFNMKGIKSLTWPARHLDRMMASQLNRQDWQKLALELQKEMTDEVIDEAIKNLPPEVYPVSGTTIAAKLKSRRGELPEAIDRFYTLLARYVDVRGSNSQELFEVKRQEGGTVSVSVFALSKKDESKTPGKQLFRRTFIPSETKEIRLFGLGGKDIFRISGEAPQGIKIRIISGDGKDEVVETGSPSGKKTLVYDSSGKDVLDGAQGLRLKAPQQPVEYEYDRFAYNTYLPIPSLGYAPDNGFGLGLSISWTTQGFDKPDYASKHTFSLAGTTVGNLNAKVESRFRQAVGKFDLGLLLRYAGPDRRFTNFYGLGNETTKSDSAFNANFYRINLNTIHFSPTLALPFAEKSEFVFGVLYEKNKVEDFDDVPGILDEGDFDGEGDLDLAGAKASIYLDFRDHKTFSKKGMDFFLGHTSYTSVSGDSRNFGITEGYISWYGTLRPFTLGLKAGGADTYNPTPFYLMPTMGRSNNLRGYFRDRFTGNTAAYINAELRIEVAQLMKSFLPTRFGIYGFTDYGRVWLDGVESSSDTTYQMGYGVGLFFAPITKDLTLALELGFSEEESLLFRFGLGFFVQ